MFTSNEIVWNETSFKNVIAHGNIRLQRKIDCCRLKFNFFLFENLFIRSRSPDPDTWAANNLFWLRVNILTNVHFWRNCMRQSANSCVPYIMSVLYAPHRTHNPFGQKEKGKTKVNVQCVACANFFFIDRMRANICYRPIEWWHSVIREFRVPYCLFNWRLDTWTLQRWEEQFAGNWTIHNSPLDRWNHFFLGPIILCFVD